jgi:hypothetical protein
MYGDGKEIPRSEARVKSREVGSDINTGLTSKKGDINTEILAIQGDSDPAAPIEKQQAFVNER